MIRKSSAQSNNHAPVPKTPISLLEMVAIPAFVSFAVIAVSASGALAHSHSVSIKTANGKRCIQSNGMPSHSIGQFPNRGNPHSIKAQNVNLCVTISPKRTGTAKTVRGSIGVALNGVQIRPGTADYWDPSSRRGFSRRNTGWNLEGLGARDKLGMDANNAHVDERGLYHYHGVSSGFLNSAKGTLVGYAADGFEIHYVGTKRKSSYQLKSGSRPSGPGGRYDGTYNEDFAYVAGSGNLDKCNGGTLNGKFVYFATHEYPFFPRCVWGTPSRDFMHKGNGGGQAALGAGNPRRAGKDGKRPRRASQRRQMAQGAQGAGRRPPARAINACKAKPANARCSFNGRGGRKVSGSCRTTPRNIVACVPQRRGG